MQIRDFLSMEYHAQEEVYVKTELKKTLFLIKARVL